MIDALEQYLPTLGRFDEMLEPGRAPRAHWRRFLQHMQTLPAETLTQQSRFVNDAIASDGVTFNVHADAGSASRAWELDPLPLILPADEWRLIAKAVAQRARMLNAVLADLYGAQTLLSEGLLPPALVFGQRSFLLPMCGAQPREGTHLHLYAADLARAPDGQWWVLSDGTLGPSGAGYALQNRLTLSRALPEAFRDVNVEPLAPFFEAVQDCLFRLSPTRRGESPLAVLLTPGPYNETYFEHTFLARYLGFPLVEGQDLVVRGSEVFLKTLRGLTRVHAILRRLGDDFCDPVELRADSALGVPGLVHAIRQGGVVVANALGSAVLETNALTGFYPAIHQRLFAEEMLMPSIATWWCGEAPALDYVLQHLDELVIKPAYPTIRAAPVFGHTLDAAGRARLIDRMQRQPHAYVAQEWVRLSQTPTWSRGESALLPRATTLRVFAVATANGYAVMPGGLTRVAQRETDVVSMHFGGASKDTWTLAEDRRPRPALVRPRLGAKDVAASSVDIPSRVGENLYWMGRYAERCEAHARLLRAALVREADAATQSRLPLKSLRSAAERLKIFTPVPPSRELGRKSIPPPTVARERETFLSVVVDPALAGGVAAHVLRLCSAANHVRERMSTDNWHLFNRLLAIAPGPEASLGPALQFLDEVMMACVSLAGFAMDDMTRDESWQFLLLGRRLERLTHLSALVSRVLELAAPEREASLEWLLEAANSIVTYRARYRRAPELLPVLHLVVFEQTNPHAVIFQLREVARTRQRICQELSFDGWGTGVDEVAAALMSTSLSGFEAESGITLERACTALATLLDQAEHTALDLSDDVQRRFFNHADSPAPVGVDLAP